MIGIGIGERVPGVVLEGLHNDAVASVDVSVRAGRWLREHGRRGGFPVDAVHEVCAVIDPTTANVVGASA